LTDLGLTAVFSFSKLFLKTKVAVSATAFKKSFGGKNLFVKMPTS